MFCGNFSTLYNKGCRLKIQEQAQQNYIGMLSFRIYTLSLFACTYTYLRYIYIFNNFFCNNQYKNTSILEHSDVSINQFRIVKLYQKIIF
jgi:hypothetical protein